MRNLDKELKDMGLDFTTRECILLWINSLTNQDLKDNGSQHWLCGPPGDGDVEPIVPDGYDSWESYYSLDSRINRWIQENINTYRSQELGRLYLIKALRKEFSIKLSECASYLEKNW